MTWGPWIEHDGTGCPVPIGTEVQGVRRHGGVDIWNVGRIMKRGVYLGRLNALDPKRSSWHWATTRKLIDPDFDVMRYRIRYPDALTTLREIAANPDRELATQ